MKHTQIKDTLRNIKKQKVSYLSIIVIALLGVTTFLGIDFSATSMLVNGSDHYNSVNFRDVEVASTLLLSPKDIQDIKNVEGVADAEGYYFTEAKAFRGSERYSVDVVSATERINRIETVSGNLPQAADECAVEKILAEKSGWTVGDKIELVGGDGGNARFVKERTFTITAVVNHPDNVSSILPTDPYIVVPPAAFDSEALEGCFMKAAVTLEKPEGIYRYSDEYKTMAGDAVRRIEEIAASCSSRRENEIIESHAPELAEGEKKLSDAEKKLENAKKELEEGREKLVSGFEQLEDAKAKVRETLIAGSEKYFGSKITEIFRFSEKRTADVDDPDETAMYLDVTDNFKLNLDRTFSGVVQELIGSESFRDYVVGTLEKESQKFGTAVDRSRAETAFGLIVTKFVDEIKNREADFTKLSDACREWDNGHKKYLDGRAEYESGLVEYEKGKADYEAACEKLDIKGTCKWVVLDAGGNAGYVQINTGSTNLGNLKNSFSLMFVIVGALVIIATVGKMIDEQRKLVGTTKALGFFNREVFAKYAVFGVSATFIGTVLGILLARFFVSRFIVGAVAKFYVFDMYKTRLNIGITAAVTAVGIVMAFASVYFACSKLLHSTAINLLQTKVPGKKGYGGGRKVLSLYSRLIILNMRMDLKRVIVTIVSVAGCCALVIIGFTLRSALIKAPEIQYGEIIKYDVTVKHSPESGAEENGKYASAFDSFGAKYLKVYNSGFTYNLNGIQLGELICGDITEINRYQKLADWKTGKDLYPTNEGVIIQRRLAEIYKLEVGSTFDIAVGGTKTGTVRVGGIYENYLGRVMVMSPAYYKTVFGEECPENAYLVKLNGADAKQLDLALREIGGYDGMTRADSEKYIIESSLSMIDQTLLLFIFMAGVMAGIVLMNLTNMYIMQKKRELTIMRVNGFTVREVIGYVLRETVLTTVLGIVFGIGVGSLVSYAIVRSLEQEFLRFVRGVDCFAWLMGAVLTVVFTVAVNFIALRKVKNLKLTDIA